MEYNYKFSSKKEIEEFYNIIIRFLSQNSIKSKDEKKFEIILKKLQKIKNKEPIKIKSRKAKGRNLQYYICEKIAELLNFKFDQQDDLCPIHSREMGQSGVDIIFRNKEVLDKFPYSIECKNVEKLSINQIVKIAENSLEKNNDKYKNWLVFYKNNKLSYPIVIIDIFEFFSIYKKGLKND